MSDGYIGLKPSSDVVEHETRVTLVALGGETVINAIYTVNYLDVFINGVKQQVNVDFTATNGTSFSLVTPATIGDVIEYNYKKASSPYDYYSKSEIDIQLATKLNTANGVMTGPILTKSILEAVTSPVITAGSLDLNLSLSSVFDVALNNNITTFTVSNPPIAGVAIGFTLIFTADGTARSVIWPVSFKWASGTAPTLTSTNGKKDFFSFYTQDAGATYQAFIAGQNL